MAITQVASYTPTDRQPQAFTLSSPAALEINNQTTMRLTVFVATQLRDVLYPGDHKIYRGLNNLVVAPSWVMVNPDDVPDSSHLAGFLTILSYGASDPLPAQGSYSPGTFTTPELTVQDRNTPVRALRAFDAGDFGAVGDGVTDDTAAIQGAIDCLSVLGGGRLQFAALTYIVQGLVWANHVEAVGMGIDATVLKLKSGANTDLISGGASNVALINLAAPFGTSQTSGSPILQDFALRDLTLDGNKAGQSSGTSYCFRAYCCDYEFSNVRMRNGFTGGVLTDWNGSGVPSGSNSVESSWHNVKIHDCNGVGLQMGGPSDSVFQDVIIFFTGSHALHLAPNCGGTMMTNVHAWGMATGVSAVGMLIESGFNYFTGCEAEGSDTCQLVLLSESNEWAGGATYAANGGTACVGVQLGQPAGGTPYAGSLNQSGGVRTAAVAQSNYIDSRITECRNGAVNFANSNYNHVIVRNNQVSGTIIAGARGAFDLLMISSRFGDNQFINPGAFAIGQDTSSTVITTGWTIGSGGHGVFRANPGAAVTGVILQNGVAPGQMLTIINEAAAANTITMAAAGTSHVADGVSCVIAGLTQKTFLWDSGTSLWYHS